MLFIYARYFSNYYPKINSFLPENSFIKNIHCFNFVCLDVEAIEAERASMEALNTSVFKIFKIISIIQSACVNSDSEFDILLKFYY